MCTPFDKFFFRVFSILCLFAWTAAQNSNTKFVGCFLGENALSFGDERRTFSPMSPQSCSAFCAGKRYAFFNLRKDTCHCSKNYLAREMVQYFEDCKIKCTGDYSASCGGSSNFVSSYLTDNSNFKIDDRFFGCFTRPEMPSSNMEFELLYTNSPDVCSAICTNEAYSFAGVEGLKCVCSNSVPRSYQKLHSSECDRNCVGDPNKTCGGEDRIQIYDLRRPNVKTKVKSTPIYPAITEPPRRKSAITTTTESNYFTGKHAFLNINTYWKHEVYIPNESDNEFVYYDKSDNNAFVENEELVIKPTIISDTEFIKKGSLHLDGCTRNDDSGVCARTALSYDILLPPIVSAKLTTENSELFKYGKVEVVAKLPIGDWIVTEMALVSKHNDKSKLVLLAKGNADLKCKGRDENVNALNAAYTLIDDRHFANSSTYIYSSKKWTDDYHSFEFSRTPNSVVVKVDGKIYDMDRPNFVGFDSIFSSQLYLSISVSAGGMRYFNDDCLSKGRTKPWRNYHPKAMLNFYNDMNNWSSTWTEERSKLRIRSVKFSKLD